MQTNIKTKDRKKLWLQALVDSGCIYIEINKKLVKDKKIKTEPINILFKVFNADGTKDREVTGFILLEVEVNKHKERINAVATDLNRMDKYLGYNWLVKHNSEVNQKTETIQFTKCSRICRTQHQDILFILRTRRIQPIDNQDQGQQEIEKEPDPTNPEDFPKYI